MKKEDVQKGAGKGVGVKKEKEKKKEEVPAHQKRTHLKLTLI